MEFRIDILDDRLEALQAGDDRERLRCYFGLWRADVVDPLSDPGVVVIVSPGDGPRPDRLAVNDGEGPVPRPSGAPATTAPVPRRPSGRRGVPRPWRDEVH